MTVQPTFFDWVRSGLDWSRPPYESCSPNLLALRAHLDVRWPGGASLGCEGNRPIRQGVTQSEHSFSAAWDWRYPAGVRALNGNVNLVDINREREEISRWVIDFSLELGICAIHDYLGDRIWRAGRTSNIADAHGSWWRKQNGAGAGMGESWAHYFHFVTTFDMFHNAIPIVDRLLKPDEEEDMTATIEEIAVPKGAWAADWFPYVAFLSNGVVRIARPSEETNKVEWTDEGQYRRTCAAAGIQLAKPLP